MSKFSVRFKELRKSRKLSQQALADSLNTSKSSVNMYERGEREPGIDTLETIADFFNVDMDYLLGKSDIVNKAIYNKTDSVSSIGDYIKQLRISKGITQEELGEIIGVKKAAVQKWESGLVQNLKRNTIIQLAEYFNVPPASFIDSSIDDAISPSNYNPLEYRSSSDVVKYLRESKNMTRAEFASVLHCTEKTIKNIEEGHKLVSINLARKISNCFGLPMPNTLFSATLYDRYQKLNKRDISIVDTLLDPDEEEYVTIQTAARGGDEPGEKKISKSEAEKLLSATPQNDKYD